MGKKLAVVLIIISLALSALCGRIIYLNLTKGNDYSIQVLSQRSFKSRTIPYKRGNIQDRNGNLLATSIMVYDLIIDSKIIMSNKDYFQPTVDAVTRYFDVDRAELEEGIKARAKNSYWVLKKNLEFKEIEQFEKYINGEFAKTDADEEEVNNTKGIWFEKKYKRKYPHKSLGCSVIGFANSENVASLGIEQSYQDVLCGVEGREFGYMDNANNMENVVKDAINGENVVSSIDINIQRVVQKAIKKYMKKYKPKRIAVVVADPNTGEILAMGDDLTFNLNKPYDLKPFMSEAKIDSMSDKAKSKKLNEIWKNFCVSDSYEPGSTFKPFTVAAGLEEGKITKHTNFSCDGHQHVGDFDIKCHNVSGHGTLDVKGAIAQSCNDSLMKIGFRLGNKLTSQYQSRFGFGAKTGIDLPNETRGLVYDSDEMDSATLATNSFGQNLTVNMAQMVAAFSSVINGGNYYEPHVVKQIVTEDDELVKSFSKTLVKQTCTEDTSAFIRECLREVVLSGTGTTAEIPGYTVGGKTGTAEKVDTSGNGTGRLEDQYILSFLGAVPCEKPEVVCYTLMDSPEGNTQATAYNTELWKAIMKQVLPYLGVDKTEKVEKKVKKKNLEKEFYSGGIIAGDDGSLVKKDKTLEE